MMATGGARTPSLRSKRAPARKRNLHYVEISRRDGTPKPFAIPIVGAFGPCIDLERNPHASFHWEAGHRGGGFYTGKRLDALEGSGDEGVELPRFRRIASL